MRVAQRSRYAPACHVKLRINHLKARSFHIAGCLGRQANLAPHTTEADGCRALGGSHKGLKSPKAEVEKDCKIAATSEAMKGMPCVLD